MVECKAVAVSFGIYGGQTAALVHRRRSIIDKGLNDVDVKVKWFREHPIGTDYDISKFKHIVGIGVSAFVEFMPTWEDKYWLNSKLPRVLIIREFETLRASDMSELIILLLLKLNRIAACEDCFRHRFHALFYLIRRILITNDQLKIPVFLEEKPRSSRYPALHYCESLKKYVLRWFCFELIYHINNKLEGKKKWS